jgi:prepilin-type N-terminal cleavage/methylation domain-containing protein
MVRLRQSAGFTLVELVVVLAILGLLLGIVLVPLATQFELRQVRAQEQDMQLVRDALLGFAATTGRLPCPDTDADGAENFAAGPPITCPAGVVGELPYGTIGVPPTDAWGRLRRYHVEAAYVMPAVPGTPAPAATAMDFQDNASLRIRQRLESKATVDLTAHPEGAVAVVVSLGDNGHGANTLDGNAIPAPPVAEAVDEDENLDGNVTYITRVRTSDAATPCDDDGSTAVPNAPFCEFDDMLMWIPKSVLMSRMIEAGRLP